MPPDSCQEEWRFGRPTRRLCAGGHFGGHTFNARTAVGAKRRPASAALGGGVHGASLALPSPLRGEAGRGRAAIDSPPHRHHRRRHKVPLAAFIEKKQFTGATGVRGMLIPMLPL